MDGDQGGTEEQCDAHLSHEASLSSKLVWSPSTKVTGSCLKHCLQQQREQHRSPKKDKCWDVPGAGS